MTALARVKSINVGRPEPNPYTASPHGTDLRGATPHHPGGRRRAETTGINKRPQSGPVQVRAPGPKTTGLGSGLVGDHIGDPAHHGGDRQAVYAFAREDLDTWEERLGRGLADGFFGENLTTQGLDLAQCRPGERWRVGSVELVVTDPRIPCATFRGWVGEAGWLKLFTADARPGAYLSVAVAGEICSQDTITRTYRPHHEVTIGMVFRALTTEPELMPKLWDAEEFLALSTRERLTR